MASGFRATSEEDLPAVRASLKQFFDMSDEMPFIDPVHLHWKYYAPRSDWPGSRSYVMDRSGHFVAHGCAWPFHLLRNGVEIPGFHLIDWGADRSVSGAGVSLLRKMLKLADIVCSFSGSAETQEILPAFGFEPANTMQVFARPLRPLRQMLSHQSRDYKLPARTVRNLLWRYVPPIKRPSGWRAEPSEAARLTALFPTEVHDRLVCARSVDFFRYLAECKSATFWIFTMFNGSAAAGYFVLSEVPGHVRIADIWTTSQSLDAYASAYMTAAATALEVSRAAELVAASAWPVAQQAIQQAGFRLRESTPVMVYSKSLGPKRIYDFQMVDSDAAFLRQIRPEYRT